MSRYHHGDLPRQLLTQAATMAADDGPDAITLRELARRTGVTHSAPVHHFGTRRGLLTALAVDGFTGLNDALTHHLGDIYGMGVAYVTWALAHPGHYAVMWQPRLLDDQDAELLSARRRAWELLSSAIEERAAADEAIPDVNTAAYAAFAIVHGLASIWLSGALPTPDDPTALARLITRHLAIGDAPPATSRRGR